MTMNLDPDLEWSDGKPITSADVKWSLEELGGHGALFTSYTSSITRIDTPDPQTVVIHTKRPDARIIGGLFIYVLPKHVWGKVPLSDLTGQYKPELPLVGSGPYMVTEYERGRIIKMERNPNWRGEPGPYDEIQFIKYGNQDAVERALTLGEIDLVREVESSSYARLGEQDNVAISRSGTPAYTQLAFNMCPERYCPDANFNPAIQDRTVRQAIGYAVDRQKLQEIATRGTSFVANGILPSYYKAFYEQPEQTYPYDPDLANQMLDEAGWVMNDDGVREKDGETLVLQPLRALGVPVHGADGEADRRDGAGHRGRVQRPGGEHRQALRPDRPEDRRQALTGLRHVHLGVGRRSLRPELPAQHPDDRRDRRVLGLLLFEPHLRQALPRADGDLRHRGPARR